MGHKPITHMSACERMDGQADACAYFQHQGLVRRWNWNADQFPCSTAQIFQLPPQKGDNSMSNILTNSSQRSSSWEATGCPDSQEIPHLLQNPKVSDIGPNTLATLFPVNPVHNLTSYFLKIHYSSIYAYVFQRGIFPSDFPTTIMICISHSSHEC